MTRNRPKLWKARISEGMTQAFVRISVKHKDRVAHVLKRQEKQEPGPWTRLLVKSGGCLPI
jgi:hypothetical protein